MFELYQVGLAFIATLFGLVVLAGVTWRKRSNTQGVTIEAPEFVEFSNAGSACFYVATTFADRPLDRVTAHGLGFAGKACLDVTDECINVFRSGERSFRINASSLIDLSRTSGVIDKAVERNGLLSVRWRLGDKELESYFRFTGSQSRDEFASKVSNLLVGVN